MLPEFGWTELLMIGIVLIVVIGPKDLPRVIKGFSKGLKSARKMSDDFRKQFSDAMDDAELSEMRELANDMKSLDPRTQIKSALAPLSKLGADVKSDLKYAAEELEAPSIHPMPEFKSALDKPPSIAEQALATSGDKAKAAQPKPKPKPKTADKAKPKAKADAKSPAIDAPADAKLAPVTAPMAEPLKKPVARKAPVKKAPAKKTVVAKKTAEKPAAKKTTVKKTTAKKTTAKKITAKTAAAKPASSKSDDAA